MITKLPELLGYLEKWKTVGEMTDLTYERLPRELHFELTYRCDATCRMCDVRDLYGKFGEVKEMTAAEIARVIDASPLLDDIGVVVLSGGEPTLRDDLPDIAGLLRKRFPAASIGILSNFIDKERVLRQLAAIDKRCGLRGFWLSSSLDGACAATHDHVRGVPGAFNRMRETIAAVKDKYPLDVSLTYTVTTLNYSEVAAAAAVAEEWGCWFGVQFVDQKTTTEQYCFTGEMYKQAEDQIRIVMERIVEKEEGYARINESDPAKYFGLWAQLYYLGNLIRFGRDAERLLRQCPAGRRFIMLDPYGNLSFCPILKAKMVGNVRQEGLAVLWDSSRAGKLRASIAAGNCACWLLCTSIITLNETFKTPPPQLPLSQRSEMPPSAVDISIIIPVKNEIEHIAVLLDKIAAQRTQYSYEVIAIDSGSKDGTLDVLRKSQVRLEAIPAAEFNHGTTRNLGATLARGNWLVFINADAVPETASWLEALVAPLCDTEIAGVYSKIIPARGSDPLTVRELVETPEYRRTEPLVKKITDREEYSRMNYYRKRRFVAFESVSCAVRRQLFLANPFREICLGEDLEWGKRMLEQGYGLVYQPGAAVSHANNFYRSFGLTLVRHRLDAACTRQIFGKREVWNPFKAACYWYRDVVKDYTFLRRTEGYSRKWYIWAPLIRAVAKAGRLLGDLRGK